MYCNNCQTNKHLIKSLNGLCCSECYCEIDSGTFNGFTCILDKQPTESGLYILKGGNVEIPAMYSNTLSGNKTWVRLDNNSTICTHWKKIEIEYHN